LCLESQKGNSGLVLYDRGESVYQTIDLIAVLVTVLLTCSELAIGVFVHPVLSKLEDAAHAEAAKPLARLIDSEPNKKRK
jgi:hypothetical protein